jgi:predicted aconitase with swiveling domain
MGCWVACLRWGRKVALVATVLWQWIITSLVVTAIVVCEATSIITAVVVVAT